MKLSKVIALAVAINFCPMLMARKEQESKKIRRALLAAQLLVRNDKELKKSDLPKTVIQKIQIMLKQNPTFVQAAIVQDVAEPLDADFRYTDRLKLHRATIDQLLASMALENHANNVNTIIRIPVGTEAYYMRIAGEPHRDANATCTLGTRTGRALDLFVKHYNDALSLEEEQELDAFKRLYPKTVQTISQIVFYSWVKCAVATHKIKTLRIPITGLVHVPGRSCDVEDKNYVVVQQELRNCFSLWEHPELRKRVTKQQIVDIKKVIQFAGLWDIKTNLFLCLPTAQYPKEQLGLIDFEQPSCTNTDHPAYLDDARRKQLAQVGLDQLRELLMNDHPEAFE